MTAFSKVLWHCFWCHQNARCMLVGVACWLGSSATAFEQAIDGNMTDTVSIAAAVQRHDRHNSLCGGRSSGLALC